MSQNRVTVHQGQDGRGRGRRSCRPPTRDLLDCIRPAGSHLSNRQLSNRQSLDDFANRTVDELRLGRERMVLFDVLTRETDSPLVPVIPQLPDDLCQPFHRSLRLLTGVGFFEKLAGHFKCRDRYAGRGRLQKRIREPLQRRGIHQDRRIPEDRRHLRKRNPVDDCHV